MAWMRGVRKGSSAFLAGFLACAHLVLASGSDPLPAGSGRTLPGPAPSPIIVRHPGGMIAIHDLAPALALGSKLEPVALAAAEALPERIGAGLPPEVQVVIVGEAGAFRALAHRDPRTVLGAARPEAGIAVLNAARLEPGPEANAAGVLRHELAHLALGAIEIRHGPFPRWFDEGAASWFAGGAAELGPIDLAAAAGAAELTLARLGTGFPEDPRDVSRAYAKSQLAVALIAERIGGDDPHLRPLVRALAAGMPFPEALRVHAGLDEAGLEAALRQETLGQELVAALTRHAQWVFGVGMALLAGLGFLMRRWRWRRRMAGWEREERGVAGQEERTAGGDREPNATRGEDESRMPGSAD